MSKIMDSRRNRVGSVSGTESSTRGHSARAAGALLLLLS
jgi:hypothetical protein